MTSLLNRISVIFLFYRYVYKIWVAALHNSELYVYCIIVYILGTFGFFVVVDTNTMYYLLYGLHCILILSVAKDLDCCLCVLKCFRQ